MSLLRPGVLKPNLCARISVSNTHVYIYTHFIAPKGASTFWYLKSTHDMTNIQAANNDSLINDITGHALTFTLLGPAAGVSESLTVTVHVA